MRYAILSDIHGNLAALRAVLSALGPVDALWCLGDVVGYGPDPNECVDLVRRLASVCLAGNHDRAATGQIGVDHFNTDASKVILWTRQRLTTENKAYLAGLPSLREVDGVVLAHGSPRDPVWEYVASTEIAKENFPLFRGPLCLVGHTHRPALFHQVGDAIRQSAIGGSEPLSIASGRFLINPGSVGQPRDGDPRSSCLILDTTERTGHFARVAYDIEQSQTRMLKARLPAHLISRLEYGT